MQKGNPHLRRDLRASGIQADGVSYVEVSDPHSGSSFQLYDFEHTVALAFDGRPLDQATTGLRQSAGLDFTVEQLSVFADRLEELGFLEAYESGHPDEMVTPVNVLPDSPAAPALPRPSQPFGFENTQDVPTYVSEES